MRKAMVILFLALSAAAEQKNVQILTGLSDIQMQRTMNMMRASLGVHCDYCHVVKNGWNFASEEKPAKQRAREMIRLVMTINSSAFGGKPVVSCYTCHGGSIRPASLVALPQAAPPYPTPVPQTPPLADAKTIVAKYAAALGKVERLTLPRVLEGERIRRISRTVRSSGEAPSEEVRYATKVVEDGPRIRVVETDARQQTSEQVVTAAEGWMRDDKGVAVMPPPVVETMRLLADAYALVLPSQFGESAKTVAKERIGEREAWVVEQGRERFYFDESSGLLLRKVLLTPSPIGTIPQQTDFEDWRDANGTKFPFRVSVALVDPWVSATRQYTRVELGARVDGKQFEKPQ